MKKVILLTGESAYFSHNICTEHLGKALIKLGYDTQIIDLGAKNFGAQLNEHLGESEFVFSFNGRGYDLTCNDGQPLYDFSGTPFVFALGDHPIHHFNRLKNCPNNCLLLCNDLSHYNAILANKQFTSNANMVSLMEEWSYLFPLEEVDDDYEQFSNRPIDILFPCSYQGVAAIFDFLDKLPKKLKELCFLIIDIGITEDYHSIDEIANYVFQEQKITFRDKFNLNMSLILSEVDSFIRGYRREKAVSSLLEKGFTVHVCGNGWEKFAKNPGENLVVHHVTHNNETLALIRQSKVVVNVGPLWPHSPHERVLASMNLGTAVISDRNCYYEKNFTHKENILLFSSKDTNYLGQSLKYYLQNSKKLFDIAKNGQKHIQNESCWDKYAEHLIELIEMYKKIGSI